MTPEQKQQAGLEAMINRIVDARVDARVEAKIAKLTIKSGQNIKFSGSGFNITGTVTFPNQPLQGQSSVTDGDWGPLTTACDGSTFEPFIRNYTPPPP